ncbi:MAG: phosphoserine phosphatase SerB [Hyphomicrobiales bacterium]|nr:phosphoserine phosphatase SerB [Hyphomicrobiales bacterium]
MHFTATLICHPQAVAGFAAEAEALAAHLPQARLRWLAPDRVADITFAAGSLEEAQALAGPLSGQGAPARAVDVIIQPEDAFRRKRLLLADMDSTMIGQECIDELADFAGVKAKVAGITERAMRGEIAFEPALRERVALLQGMATGIVDQVIAERIVVTPGAKTLIATMKAHGAFTALISGGFDVFTSRIAAKIGFDLNRANRLLESGGRFTGAVAEPILGRAAKSAALQELAAARNLDLRATMAVGDGANDLDMIRQSGLGVAYHAKPQVAAAAHASIQHNDLTALLYAQGFREGEFVAV